MTEHTSKRSPSALHQALQQATREHHEALHVHPRLEKLASPAVDHTYWIDALKGFYGFYATAEASLAASKLDIAQAFAAGEKVSALRHDLERQGVSTDT